MMQIETLVGYLHISLSFPQALEDLWTAIKDPVTQ